MPKRLKFVVEQWVLFTVRRQTWQAQRFEIFESARHFRIESNRDVRFEFESNLEASQVPTLKWKFSKMSFRIPRRDTEPIRFVTKFGENGPLRSCRKVLWITTQKKLGLRGTRPSPHFGQNGPIAPKIPWTLSPFHMSTYTKFGLDRLRFAGLIQDLLIFRPEK